MPACGLPIYRTTRPEASPAASRSTSALVTLLKSPGIVCLRQLAAKPLRRLQGFPHGLGARLGQGDAPLSKKYTIYRASSYHFTKSSRSFLLAESRMYIMWPAA